MFVSSLLCVAIALASASTLQAASVNGKRVLILADGDKEADFSGFVDILKARGYELTIKNAETDAALFKYGEAQYEHLINLAPEANGFGGLSAHTVVDFVNQGGNLLLAGSSSVNSVFRDLSAEIGLDFEDDLPEVVDHFAFAQKADENVSESGHSLVLSERASHLALTADDSPILYQGPSLSFAAPIRPHALLTARPTAVVPADASAISPANYPKSIGRRTVLVAGLQARNEARISIAASGSLFSNSFLKASSKDFKVHGSDSAELGNAKYVNDLIAWNFRETGVVRVKSVKHNKVGSTNQPDSYRIKDDVEYRLQLEEWNGEKWVSFVEKDVQLEVTMLNPYLRLTLNVSADEPGTLIGKFKLPDVYGVFTFRIEYESAGRTVIRNAFQIPILPFRHNEYERFIPAAFPYYAGAFTMMVSFWLFSWVWLYHSEPAKATTTKSKTN